jgi:hypothetical protein
LTNRELWQLRQPAARVGRLSGRGRGCRGSGQPDEAGSLVDEVVRGLTGPAAEVRLPAPQLPDDAPGGPQPRLQVALPAAGRQVDDRATLHHRLGQARGDQPRGHGALRLELPGLRPHRQVPDHRGLLGLRLLLDLLLLAGRRLLHRHGLHSQDNDPISEHPRAPGPQDLQGQRLHGQG